MIARGRNINVTLIFSLRALRRGRRGLPPRARAARRGRRRPVAASRRWRASSSRASTPRPTGGSTRPARPTSSRASSRSRTRSSPTSATRSSSPASAGRRSRAKGARTQRCLWASTSTKNPAYRDVLYVEELIGPETVNTMPRGDDRGLPGPRRGGAHARDATSTRRSRVFERVAEAGVDYDDVVAMLEREGVQKFSDSFAELLEGVARQARRARLGLSRYRDEDLLRGRRRGAGGRARPRGHLRQPHVGPAVGDVHARPPRPAATTCAASGARRSRPGRFSHARDLLERPRAARLRARRARWASRSAAGSRSRRRSPGRSSSRRSCSSRRACPGTTGRRR